MGRRRHCSLLWSRRVPPSFVDSEQGGQGVTQKQEKKRKRWERHVGMGKGAGGGMGGAGAVGKGGGDKRVRWDEVG